LQTQAFAQAEPDHARVSSPVFKAVIPQLVRVEEQLSMESVSPYDVHDGKGHVVQSANAPFRALLRTMHEEYKSSNHWGEKRSIAKSVYENVLRNGGRFLDANGNPKSEVSAMKKIMKSLKDMPVRPTLKPSKKVLSALPPRRAPAPSIFNNDLTNDHDLFAPMLKGRNPKSAVMLAIREGADFIVKSKNHDEMGRVAATETLSTPQGLREDEPQQAQDDCEPSQVEPSDIFHTSIPISSSAAAIAAGSVHQEWMPENSSLLDLDMFQEAQITLEKSFELLDVVIVPFVWQVSI
jgi:hypothetical protein